MTVVTHIVAKRATATRLLAATAVVALAACSQVSVVENYQTGFFSPAEYGADASKGEMPVAVTGGAFGLTPGVLADVTVRNMQGADWPPHARMTVLPGPNTTRMYHYVMMWNGPRDVTVSNLCANPARPQPAAPNAGADGTLVLIAGLCRFDKATNGVTVTAGNVAGPGDVKFRQMIVSAVQELTRPNQRDIFERDRDSRPFFHL
ncbi:MAG: hypothetical protein ACM30I_12690 [Gemmatimonas sp.]